jgi:hypothetical protein
MRESRGFLVLADISGYTEYIRSHKMRGVPILGKRMAQTSQVHAETVITDLLETLIAGVGEDFTLNKLEGDAALFFRESSDISEESPEILRTMLNLFEVFTQRVEDLMFCQTCLCDCCQQMNQLKVKVFVHYGEFLVKRVAQFEEIAGHDVILIHRLLKNSVPSKEYLLVTESAMQSLSTNNGLLPFEQRVETYDVGDVPIHVFYPTPNVEPSPRASWLTRYRAMVAFFQTPKRKGELALGLLSGAQSPE